jgi:hypothetical protein
VLIDTETSPPVQTGSALMTWGCGAAVARAAIHGLRTAMVQSCLWPRRIPEKRGDHSSRFAHLTVFDFFEDLLRLLFMPGIIGELNRQLANRNEGAARHRPVFSRHIAFRQFEPACNHLGIQ